jgi:lysozyme family protein
MVLIIDKGFARAVELVLAHEGGFSANKADRGGATKYGISLRFLKTLPDGDINRDGDIDAEDVSQLTRDQAIDFYWREFWNKHHYDQIMDWHIAAKIFDMAVNMGPQRAHRLLQQGILACGKKVVVDGKLGPQTLRAVNSTSRESLLPVLRAEAAGFYRAIVLLDPSQRVFLGGWLRRAYASII